MARYVAGMPMMAMARPPRAGPRMFAPVQAEPGPRGTARGVLDGDDLCLEGGERRSLEAGRHADEEDDQQDAAEADVLGVEREPGEGQGADDEERRPSAG